MKGYLFNQEQMSPLNLIVTPLLFYLNFRNIFIARIIKVTKHQTQKQAKNNANLSTHYTKLKLQLFL